LKGDTVVVVDTRRYYYDENWDVIRERTKEEIELIDLKNSSLAHREWLEHLEELVFNLALELKNGGAGTGLGVTKAIKNYNEQMENL
jgi:hypothetical protein